jgi:hypothetical protein
MTSPVVYNWTAAALLLYGSFAALIMLVPVLSIVFPVVAVALVPLIATLVSFANWLSEAGKRGAFGAANYLRRWLQKDDEQQQQPQQPAIANPVSTFALYVNTSALVWLFGFMLLEVILSSKLPCDAPLHTFVLGAAVLGLFIAIVDFVADVFKDPMPPVTKLEQTRAKDDRRRRLHTYAWLTVAILIWGALGLIWLRKSTTCALTAPTIYRISLLLGIVYSLVVAVLLLLLVALAIDFCLSGKLRMVVILEQ